MLPPRVDWQIVPYGHVQASRREYRGETLVLETDYETAEGTIRLVDFMPSGETTEFVRLVEGVRGRVRVHMDLRLDLDGPWVRHDDGAQTAIAGADTVWLRTPVETRDDGFAVRADFFVTTGELVPFVLTWHPSHETAPAPIDPFRALAEMEVTS